MKKLSSILVLMSLAAGTAFADEVYSAKGTWTGSGLNSRWVAFPAAKAEAVSKALNACREGSHKFCLYQSSNDGSISSYEVTGHAVIVGTDSGTAGELYQGSGAVTGSNVNTNFNVAAAKFHALEQAFDECSKAGYLDCAIVSMDSGELGYYEVKATAKVRGVRR